MKDQNKQYKRKRNIQLPFMVDEKEREIIYKRMKETGIFNRSAFLRKVALNGWIIHVNLDSVDEMVRLLSGAANNINNIAHCVNTTGNIYQIDIDELKKMYDDLYEQAQEILRRIPVAGKDRILFYV